MHRVTSGHEIVHDVAVTPTVLRPAVDDQQYRLGFPLRPPTLVVELQVFESREIAFLMLHVNLLKVNHQGLNAPFRT